jgi:peptidyl-dipeptidase A
MFCEQPLSDPLWLTERVSLDQSEAQGLAPRLRSQETASLLAFVRWCLTIVHFERAFYADPTQDLNSLWWNLEQRFQLVPRPEGRDAPDWAAKIHVATAPVYYHKYLYGQIFAAQLSDTIRQRFGGWWSGRARSGRYVARELFAPGATYPWPELVERLTGAALNTSGLAAGVRWPAAD